MLDLKFGLTTIENILNIRFCTGALKILSLDCSSSMEFSTLHSKILICTQFVSLEISAQRNSQSALKSQSACTMIENQIVSNANILYSDEIMTVHLSTAHVM